MHSIDILDQLLVNRGSVGIEQVLRDATGGLLADVVELAAVRWSWHQRKGEDLLQAIAGPLSGGMIPPTLLRGSLVKAGSVAGGEVFEIPPLGSGWEAGSSFMVFQERFKTQLVRRGLPSRFAHGLVAAMNEMASNAIEHAASPLRPVCSYDFSQERWAFSVTDVGCGVLESLRRNSQYADLKDHVQGLRLAATDGVSSTGSRSRGYGFTTLFKALVNRMCSIRFRTTEAVASWQGSAPAVHSLQLMPMPPRAGFHVCISGGLR